ncbi:MAG: hypothetical protein PHD61_11285 [Bacteroidales bacterium]|nr:hypothetical protein [Bacteroidales bacterium]
MRIIATYFLLIILPIISFGQTQIGIKSEYIYFWFSDHDEGHYTSEYDYPRSDYSLAIIARHRIPETPLNFGLEIEYANRSFSVKSYSGGFGGGQSIDYSYTVGNLYFHFQPQFTFGKKFRFYFYPGFYWGILINSQLTGSLSGWQMGNPPYSGTIQVNGSAKDYYPNWEFGIYPGIGFEFPLYKQFDFIFDYSFTTNFSNTRYSWASDRVKMFSMNFGIGVIYNLSLLTD